ncbi:hypothetical protein Glove_428g20 [Diversispora epigaea]|uniref:Uncharacterized protein n=1 Tax=Diversispora epigaea TaxID=1348612 RepID=A0A397GXV8_9GLOM|nr:hypothetical protein Glove_428g20 [Diversispora epigaea]
MCKYNDSEDIDIDSLLLPEPIGEPNERTDIELKLKRLISIEKYNDSEDIDIDSLLLPEPIGEPNERTDIELKLKRLISIEKNRFCINLKKSKYLKNPKSILGTCIVIINNSNKNLKEENSSIDESNIDNKREDYNFALFVTDYLSESDIKLINNN